MAKKNKDEIWIRINRQGLQDKSYKVVGEDNDHYIINIDGKEEKFYKAHCSIDRKKQFETLKTNREKAQLIGLNQRRK